MESIGAILVGITVLGIIVFGIGVYLSCPKCKSWWSRKNDGSKITNENTKFETITRYDIHRNKEGKEIGRTERKEQIKVKYTDYLNYHSCNNCNHNWTTTSTSRVEM
jgi:hypothetical protein